MNMSPVMLENQNLNEVASFLIPVGTGKLLVPAVTVAEIVAYSMPVTEAGSPDWLLGQFRWREQQVPLLSYELLNGQSQPALHGNCRVAVLNTTGTSDELSFIAIPTQGIPHIARVVEEDIQARESVDKANYELMAVSLLGEELVIPDVAALERVYLDWRQA